MQGIGDGGEANERNHAGNVVEQRGLAGVGAAYDAAEAEEEYAYCRGFDHRKKHGYPNYQPRLLRISASQFVRHSRADDQHI